MTADRFEELRDDKDGKPRQGCPKCGSRDVAQDLSFDMGIVKLGPNWLRCLECDSLFIRNEDEEVEIRDKDGRVV